jgi:hypothetical protein
LDRESESIQKETIRLLSQSFCPSHSKRFRKSISIRFTGCCGTKPLAAEGAENCEVTAVESLGENLWRVDLKGRQWGKPQSIRLSIGAAKPKAAK